MNEADRQLILKLATNVGELTDTIKKNQALGQGQVKEPPVVVKNVPFHAIDVLFNYPHQLPEEQKRRCQAFVGDLRALCEKHQAIKLNVIYNDEAQRKTQEPPPGV